MLKNIALALCMVAGLAGAAFAQGSWACDNAIGIYTDPDPTSRTAQELANYDGPPGVVTAYVVLTNPVNTNTSTPIGIVGGFEFGVVLPANVQLLAATLPPATVNFATAPDFSCGANLPVIDGRVTLMTLTLSAPDGAASLVYVAPVQESAQSVPGEIVITDFDDDFRTSIAQPSSGDYGMPAFGLFTGGAVDLSPCIGPLYVATDGDDTLGDGSRDAPWGTIQYAIDTAIEGDTIVLLSGTYRGPANRDLDFYGKGLVLQGETGAPEDVIIDCQGTAEDRHFGFHFHSNEPVGTTIEGLTIRNAYGPGATPAAIRMDRGPYVPGISTRVRFSRCVVDSATGDGLTAGDWDYPIGPLTIEDCEFINNTGRGVSLYSVSGSLNNCRMHGNGGAGAVLWDYNGTITNCEFSTNSGAGCINGLDLPFRIDTCVFSGNSTGFVGYGDLRNCTIRDNTGNGVSFFGSPNGPTRVGNCEVFGNGGFGIAVEDGNSGWLSVQQCMIANNGGGGVQLDGGGLSMYESLIVNNGGAGALLGGIDDEGSSIDGCTVAGNESGLEIGYSYSHLSISFTIIAFNQGEGLIDDGVEYSNCDVFGNGLDLAPDGWRPGVNGNFGKDPFFCDAAIGNYGIAMNSPCAPALLHGLIGAEEVLCEGTPPPVLLAVEDVPSEQGGQVRLSWYASGHDVTGSATPILGYNVYRRIDAKAAAASPATGDKLLGWDYLMQIPARGDQGYHAIAPTLCDAAADGTPCPSVFLVSAVTADPLVFFHSEPDSGSSVDNLVPGIPGTLQVAYAATGNRISWTAPADPDIAGYQVWRTGGEAPGEDPGEPSATVAVTEWLDTEFTGAAWTQAYWVAAVDHSGNRGPLTQWTTAGVSPVGDSAIPRTFALHGNVPNPFNPSTTLRFDLPAPARVDLAIYDVAGRRVRSIVTAESYPAGRHEVIWDGRNDAGSSVGSGIYLYRINAGDYTETRRMALVR